MSNPIFVETNTRIAALPGIQNCDYSAKEARQSLANLDGSRSVGNLLNISNPIATTTSAEILAANTDRQELFIQNIGVNDIYLNFNSAASLTNGYKLTPNEVFNIKNFLIIQSSIEVISDTNPVQLYIIETLLS